MKKFLLLVFVLCFPLVVFAEQEIQIALGNPNIDLHDKEAIKRGAKFYSTVCMACHTMVYMRYDKIAQENGVVYNRMPIYVKSWPFGVVPPDLSLEADRRGVNWIYTYLHSFYVDKSRPTGANNLLVPNTAMPGILMVYQGQQVLVPKSQIGKKIYDSIYEWYDLIEPVSKGTMTPEQFDSTMKDVVTFLQYASEPYQVEQHRIGKWVLVFLVVLFILMYLLKREYWKSIERQKRK